MIAEVRPSLFVVGHPKSGTTALHAFLSEHPEICMSEPKEPWYFCTDFHRESDRHHGRKLFFRFRSHEQYLRAFRHVGEESILGESSAVYLRSRSAAAGIASFNPRAKIVIVLREPIGFLRSLHKEFYRNAMEDEADFATALAKEPDRRSGRHLPPGVPCPSWLHYSRWVDYPAQIQRYLDVLDRSQIHLALWDDFRADNAGVYRKIVRFLGVDERFHPRFRSVNSRGDVELSLFGRLVFNPRLRWVAQNILPYRWYQLGIGIARRYGWKDAAAPTPNASTVTADLRRRFTPAIRDTSEILHRDLCALWGYDDGLEPRDPALESIG